MDDISSRIVGREEEGPSRRPRAWLPVAAALAAGLVIGFLAGVQRGPDRAQLDAARDRAAVAERQVIFLRGERDRLNGQILDQARVIARLEERLADR